MNKILVYGARLDEMTYLRISQKIAEIEINQEELDVNTAKNALGYSAITVPGSNTVDESTLKVLSEVGVKYLAVRSAGYNNVDQEAAKKYGIRFSNVSYSSNSVADFTTMLILMSVRKVKQIINRNNVQDYTLVGNQGKEIKNLTIGIVGTGKIGAAVVKNLSGFGCKLIGYDVCENDSLKNILTYVSFEELLQTSDVITLHVPLFDSNYHMINKESINKMKDGVSIVNCSRGSLIDTEALIEGLENEKIGSAALDTIEDELEVFHKDHRMHMLKNRNLSVLRSFPNVIVTPHAAFYTDQAVHDMVINAIKSLDSFMETGESPFEIR